MKTIRLEQTRLCIISTSVGHSVVICHIAKLKEKQKWVLLSRYCHMIFYVDHVTDKTYSSITFGIVTQIVMKVERKKLQKEVMPGF